MSRSLAVLAAAVAGIGLAALAPPRAACGDTYVVIRGDTLSAIALRCRSSVAAIARASGLADPDLIRIGERLVIPGAATVHTAAPQRLEAPPASYAMARNDTLYSLARWAGVSLASLMAVNPGIDPHRIEIGDRVRLPDGARDPLALRSRERGVRPRAAPPPAGHERPPAGAPEPRRDEADTVGI